MFRRPTYLAARGSGAPPPPGLTLIQAIVRRADTPLSVLLFRAPLQLLLGSYLHGVSSSIPAQTTSPCSAIRPVLHRLASPTTRYVYSALAPRKLPSMQPSGVQAFRSTWPPTTMKNLRRGLADDLVHDITLGHAESFAFLQWQTAYDNRNVHLLTGSRARPCGLDITPKSSNCCDPWAPNPSCCDTTPMTQHHTPNVTQRQNSTVPAKPRLCRSKRLSKLYCNILPSLLAAYNDLHNFKLPLNIAPIILIVD